METVIVILIALWFLKPKDAAAVQAQAQIASYNPSPDPLMQIMRPTLIIDNWGDNAYRIVSPGLGTGGGGNTPTDAVLERKDLAISIDSDLFAGSVDVRAKNVGELPVMY